MEGFENPAAWTREGVWYIRFGGGFVLYHQTPSVGRFDFAAQVRKGHSLQWVVGYSDEGNYVLYQMDEKFFRRFELVNGRRSEETKIRQGMGKDRTCTLRIGVKRNTIVQERYEDGKWITLDTWSNTGRTVGDGKVGLFIPPGEIVALANFTFQPQ